VNPAAIFKRQQQEKTATTTQVTAAKFAQGAPLARTIPFLMQLTVLPDGHQMDFQLHHCLPQLDRVPSEVGHQSWLTFQA
jgi:hypothetical protein